jgi:hypothetical protein
MVYLLNVFNVAMKIRCDVQAITSREFGKVHLSKVMSVRRMTNISDQFFTRSLGLSTLHPELSVRKGGPEKIPVLSYR